jgi:hypothetical protein
MIVTAKHFERMVEEKPLEEEATIEERRTRRLSPVQARSPMDKTTAKLVCDFEDWLIVS